MKPERFGSAVEGILFWRAILAKTYRRDHYGRPCMALDSAARAVCFMQRRGPVDTPILIREYQRERKWDGPLYRW